MYSKNQGVPIRSDTLVSFHLGLEVKAILSIIYIFILILWTFKKNELIRVFV